MKIFGLEVRRAETHQEEQARIALQASTKVERAREVLAHHAGVKVEDIDKALVQYKKQREEYAKKHWFLGEPTNENYYIDGL